jgi:uncharacterized protein (TIGR02145 family)
MNKITFSIIAFCTLFFLSCSSEDNENENPSSSSAIAQPGESGTFIDDRDGKIYRYVTIGTQIWMAENLNYSHNETIGYCYGSTSGDRRDNENCAIYGRLYSWWPDARNGSPSSDLEPSGVQGICPDGWHLPSTREWITLENAIGGSHIAGTKLKANNGWNADGNGTDDYGFSALPGGRRNPESGRFYDIGEYGSWWTASEMGSSYGRSIYMNYGSEIGIGYAFDMVGYSIRCVKDISSDYL